MGFALTILYLITYYLAPVTIFGPLAAFRIELIIAGLVFFVSLPLLGGSFLRKTPQSVALMGLAFAVFLSIVFGMHWLGGGMPAFLQFIPNAFAYFLVCLHCNSVKRLRILVFMLLFVCLFVIANGYYESQHVVPAAEAAQALNGGDPGPGEMDPSPYLLGMHDNSFHWFYRLRGLGEINDPNDFGQLIVAVLPLVFIFWKPRSGFRNFLFVLLPTIVLLFGIYLTHSRGATVATLAVVIVALRRRVGLIPSLIIAGVLFAGASALHVTGGRDISVNAGEDRTALWGEGLQLFKAYPFFGVGFGAMADHVGQTAHNSLVVCAAELGMVGLYFWSLFLYPTVRDALEVSSPAKVSEGVPIEPPPPSLPGTMKAPEPVAAIDKEQICYLGRLIFLSLTGFLVAGWFLSRSFVVTLFLLGGIAEVIFEMASSRGMIAPRLRSGQAFKRAGQLAIVLILVMYVMLRTVNVMH